MNTTNLKWFWLSFVGLDPLTGKDKHFGCCNIQAEDIKSAIIRSHILKINPGGEVMVLEMLAPELPENVLVSAEELRLNDYKTTGEISDEMNIQVKDLPGADWVCPCCNTINCNNHN